MIVCYIVEDLFLHTGTFILSIFVVEFVDTCNISVLFRYVVVDGIFVDVVKPLLAVEQI